MSPGERRGRTGGARRAAARGARATVHLVDASPYIFRAYFALPETITDPAGQPVNAVAGFAAFVLRYLVEEQPTHLALAFDGSLTTSFRNELLAEYKAQRALPPPALERQLDRCRAIGAALGAATFIDDRYEADDIIATLWAQLRRDGHPVVVVSGDKDLAQLVDDDTLLLDFARARRLDALAVREALGVAPRQVPDLLGLAGDAVDNIPGVKGVGRKTAAALLAVFPDLDALYADLGRVAELPLRGAAGLARRLDEHRDVAFLSRELATMSTEAPAVARLDELAFHGADRQRLDPLLEELGLQRLRDRVPRWREGRD